MKQIFISSFAASTSILGIFEVINPTLNGVVAILTIIYIGRNIIKQ